MGVLMGTRLISQRRGKGSNIFTAAKGGAAESAYINMDDAQRSGKLHGQITDIVPDPARTAVLAEILFENGGREFVIAAEGEYVGQRIEYGRGAEIALGNVLPLSSIVEGCPVFNIERTPGDGGNIIRSSGLYGLVVTKDKSGIYVKVPSGKTVRLNPACRATIGCAAGGGRIEKPLVKAGAAYHAMRARGRHYPTVRGVAMNPVDHPFGGSQHHVGKSKSTSRHAPPGRKVGAIASRRTGRRKKGV